MGPNDVTARFKVAGQLITSLRNHLACAETITLCCFKLIQNGLLFFNLQFDNSFRGAEGKKIERVLHRHRERQVGVVVSHHWS